MGKYFIDEKDIYRINFPDGEWIDIKTELSQTDADYITHSMAQTKIGNTMEIDIKLGRLPLLECSIVAWSFKDGDNPVPINSETISQLRSKYRILVFKEIDRLNIESQSFAKN